MDDLESLLSEMVAEAQAKNAAAANDMYATLAEIARDPACADRVASRAIERRNRVHR